MSMTTRRALLAGAGVLAAVGGAAWYQRRESPPVGSDGEPLDPVARFHLGNGARIERLNWAADASARGLEQSCGMMVNYLYEPEQLDENRARLAAGKPRVSRSVQWL